MSMMLREVTAGAKLKDHLALDALRRRLAPAVIEQVLRQYPRHGQRQRKLPAHVMVVVCLALALFAQESVPAALTISPGARCQDRYRLGARPLVALFHAVCQPLTTAATPTSSAWIPRRIPTCCTRCSTISSRASSCHAAIASTRA